MMKEDKEINETNVIVWRTKIPICDDSNLEKIIKTLHFYKSLSNSKQKHSDAKVGRRQCHGPCDNVIGVPELTTDYNHAIKTDLTSRSRHRWSCCWHKSKLDYKTWKYASELNISRAFWIIGILA